MVYESLDKAYLSMLESVLREDRDFLQVTCVGNPLVEGKLNLDPAFGKKFEAFTFPDGRCGLWWVQDRIKAVFSPKGEYHKRIYGGGYEYCLESLKGIREGNFPLWNANRLIISLFKPEDLHKARKPTPPCLINLCLYPVKGKLTMIGTFRAQYVDAKGFGNLISLAMLLGGLCEKTGFSPGRLYNVAQKSLLRYPKDIAKRLYFHLLREL